MREAVVVVQEIRTIWSKASRGGPGAVLRNAVPEAARLPQEAVRSAADFTLLHHRLIYHEDATSGFTAPVQNDLIDNSALQPYPLGCVEIGEPTGEEPTLAWAKFRYEETHGGMPLRGALNKTLLLPLGTWGQIVYNGRFLPGWSGSEWRYEKTVVNVGLFALPLPNGSLFTREEPSQRFSAMAHLF